MAVAAVVAMTPFRPAQAALAPAVARTPGELTAANAVASTVESVGFFCGPALAGVLLAVTGVEVVFALTAATLLWSALFLLGIRGGGKESPGEVQPATLLPPHGHGDRPDAGRPVRPRPRGLPGRRHRPCPQPPGGRGCGQRPPGRDGSGRRQAAERLTRRP